MLSSEKYLILRKNFYQLLENGHLINVQNAIYGERFVQKNGSAFFSVLTQH